MAQQDSQIFEEVDLYTEMTEEFNDSQADVNFQSQCMSQPLDIFNTALDSQDFKVEDTQMSVEMENANLDDIRHELNRIKKKFKKWGVEKHTNAASTQTEPVFVWEGSRMVKDMDLQTLYRCLDYVKTMIHIKEQQ